MGLSKKKCSPDKKVKRGPYDYRRDFRILSTDEKKEIVRTAKNLLQQQRENREFFDSASSSDEAEIQVV